MATVLTLVCFKGTTCFNGGELFPIGARAFAPCGNGVDGTPHGNSVNGAPCGDDIDGAPHSNEGTPFGNGTNGTPCGNSGAGALVL